MAKNSSKKPTKQFDRDYPVEPDELDGQQQRLKKAAAAAAEALNLSSPAATPDPHPALAAVSSPPLTPLAALWPDAAPSRPMPSPGKTAAITETQLPATSARIKVTFVLPVPEARHVSLSGEFNGWSPDATPLQRHEGGRWETTLALAPGRYQYKFVVDGQWITDPLASEQVRNQHGTLNSVIVV